MNEQERTNSLTDDVEGHTARQWADAESAEGGDDVEGHGKKVFADAKSAEGDDDVEGHVYVQEPDRANDNRF